MLFCAPRLQLSVYTLAWLMATLYPSESRAATPAAFAHAVEEALRPGYVAQGGTVPAHPAVTAGNRLEMALDGTREVIAELCALVASAEHEILMQFYQWDDNDAAAQVVVQALQARVQHALAASRPTVPLHIRIVINGTLPPESATSHHALLALIQGLAATPRAHERVQFELATFSGFGLAVLHTKTAVIDHAQALVMTGNLRTRGGLDGDFYNAGLHVTGPMVQVLRDDWREARGRAKVYASSLPNMAPIEARPALPPVANGVQAAVLTKHAALLPFGNVANPQDRGVIALIDTASERIEAMNPALNAAPVMEALTRAALRGVDVTLVLSLNMDRWEQQTFFGGDNAESAYALYRRLLTLGGVDAARRLHVLWASADGVQPAADGDAANVHAKAAMFDDGCFWLGSMNWDLLSWATSRELSVAFFAHASVLWRERLFARVQSHAAPLRSDDLPQWAQHARDPVYAFIRSL